MRALDSLNIYKKNGFRNLVILFMLLWIGSPITLVGVVPIVHFTSHFASWCIQLNDRPDIGVASLRMPGVDGDLQIHADQAVIYHLYGVNNFFYLQGVMVLNTASYGEAWVVSASDMSTLQQVVDHIDYLAAEDYEEAEITGLPPTIQRIDFCYPPYPPSSVGEGILPQLLS